MVVVFITLCCSSQSSFFLLAPSLMLSTVNCLHTVWMVGMETDHGCGGGNRRCSCLDSPGFVCVCVCRAAFSVSEEKFHRCYGHLPQGRFIYFRRPVTQTRLHEQRKAHFLLVLIFLFFWKPLRLVFWPPLTPGAGRSFTLLLPPPMINRGLD